MQNNNKNSICGLIGAVACTILLAACGGGGGSGNIAQTAVPPADPDPPENLNAQPIVAISTPAGGLSANEGESVMFAGTATDAEDGNLANGLRWTSDRDGLLGLGDGVTIVLSAGVHTVSAAVTDTGGLTADDQVTLSILADESPPLANSNTGSLSGEGGIDFISPDELTYADDVQSAASVAYTVTESPEYGELFLASSPGDSAQTFTQSDIDAGRLAYRHTRGNGETDEFEFRVDDGFGNAQISQTFSIRIVANVANLGAAFDSDVVTLTWDSPVGGEVDGIEIRRRDDGQYPQDRTDGTLVMQVPPGQQTVTDSFTPGGSQGEAVYYSVFSHSSNGIYSDGVRAGIYCDGSDCVTVPDLRPLTNLESAADIEARRTQLVTAIWGVETLPAHLPTSVADVDPLADPTQYFPPNAIRTEELRVDPGDPFFIADFRLRLHSPATPNGKLIIYHGGHRGLTEERKPVIERFLAEGYGVLEASMPMAGANWNSIYHPPIGTFHESLAPLDRPMRFFFEQLSVALNYLVPDRGFDDVYMVGISGGGWTTVVYAALDPRIRASYPVAGSYPFYLRDQFDDSSGGDFEQTNPGFYQHATYPELYILGSAGRRQLQVYNVFDDCCFAGTYSNTFRDHVQVEAAKVGGSFDIALDDTFVGHRISDHALEIIVTDIAAN